MDKISENAVSATIDWLSFTVKWERLRRNDWVTHDGQQTAVARLLETDGDWKRDMPLHGYEDSWLASDRGAMRVMVSRPGDRMGVHVQLPGQALQHMGVGKALRICRELEGSVTRIDVAVDVRGVSNAGDVYGAHLANTMVTRAQKCNMFIGDDGLTVYVGSRSSERFLRVYDKAAQTKTNGNWTRIEMECKGDKGKWIARYIQDEGIGAAASLIRDYVDCPGVDWYHDALTRENIVLGKPQPKKMTDTRGWLLGTVAKTLAREVTGDDAFFTEFILAVMKLKKDPLEGETE